MCETVSSDSLNLTNSFSAAAFLHVELFLSFYSHAARGRSTGLMHRRHLVGAGLPFTGEPHTVVVGYNT